MRTGRALQLEEIANSPNKVTLGFKCNAQLKISLAMEAQNYSMSLSEYVETLVENRHAQSSQQNVASTQRTNESGEIWQLTNQIKELKAKLAFFYEEPIMKKAFQESKGKIVPYIDKNGIPRRDSIITIEDVYKILFKTNKL
ncbi:hypothetical protein [Emticicia agri]|uniref:Uncharacterized protein n=1 Tax=Emticicia agri TaxID=2492393 RepID=A0A4Q5LSZ7_9BACT|nr:hypothetical protein [Emticicia agri]RYU92711.1 hypothetical protein EWM59_25735 [Emticicia agri]